MKRWMLSLALALSTALAHATPQSERVLDNISFNPPLGQIAPIDTTFRDENGASTSIRALLGGKPAIIVPVFFECPSLCTLSLNGVLRALRALRPSAGEDFTVIAVSINPKDTPALAASKRATYREGYSRMNAEKGWRFLTGDRASIDTLMNGIGFKYVYDLQTDQYAHASALVLISPDGKITRGLNGPEFEPKDLKLGLIEAAEGKIGTPIERALMYCYVFDGSTGKYSMQIMRIVQLAGVATALALLLMIILQIRSERRRNLSHAGGGR